MELDLAVDEPRRVALGLGDERVQLAGTDGNHGYRLSAVDLRDSPEEAAFREGVRAWLEQNLPAGDHREWSRKIYDAGYAGLTWPEEYGGKGAPYSHQAIVLEEFARAGAPQHMGVIGLGMAGPTIMAHGSEQQKRRYLPKILSAEEIWCQGFSEPGAGSDLSAARTKIEVEDERFVVTGQKVWSSFAHIADHCILVGRSDPNSERHAGLTYLIVDMKSPGVEVRPLKQITGEAEFNEIFLSDVEVPRENLLGEIGDGWQVAMTTLLHERGTLGFALSGVLEAQVGRLVALAKEKGADDPIIRDRVAQEWIELQALKFTNYRSLTTLMQTGIPGPEGSGAKLHWSEQNQRLTKLAMEILDGEDDGYWRHQQLRSRGNTIEAGTSEILRNIIAERVLGLPRSR
jgi:alkylation response protein AidB-like acyl-CoA dehydrogenase